MGFLGLKDMIFRRMTASFTSPKEPNLVKKDEKHGDRPKLMLTSLFGGFRNIEPQQIEEEEANSRNKPSNMDNKMEESGDKLVS